MAGAPDVLLHRLQSVLNAAVRLVFSARRFDHTNPLLCKLHWLEVPERVGFRLCVLTYRSLNGTAPHYLAETSDQSLAVEHVNTSDRPSRQPYWYHPRIIQLSVIGHSQWLLHGLGTLYRNTFGTRLLFLSSAEN